MSSDPSETLSRAPASRGMAAVALAGALGGALAGLAAGAIDGLWSWSGLAQFLPGLLGKVRFVVFLAALHALAGALVGVAAAGIIHVFGRMTRLGDLARTAMARHAEARARDPRDALVGLALVIAGTPCVAGALGLAYGYGLRALGERRHVGLVIASAMGLALLALLTGVLASFLVGRPVELGLRRLARKPALGRALSSPLAPLVALAVLVGLFGCVAVAMSWETLSLLHLRPLWIVILAACLAISTSRTGSRMAARWLGMARAWRWGLPAAGIVTTLIIMLASGQPEGVRKAAGAYSGLGGMLARGVRSVVDLDRDGHSPILGGGDCNDWNAAVHPGSIEIPDDGVDQNCVGGDASIGRSAEDVGFAPVPASVPGNFNVLLLTIDTIRADHLGAYGYERPTSPNIDAVAREGALFANAWAHAPSTRYSIPAILTGRYPLHVHYDTSIRGWPGLDAKTTTIAELMDQAGMTTGGILNYWYFGRERRMDQGFDHYDNENQRLHKQVPGQGPSQTQGSSSREQTDKAIQFIDKHAAERFFLWVHYYDPHYQYESHAEVPSFGDAAIDLYDQEIRFTDHHVGRLLDELERHGLYERTIIVITGDHGEGFGEHGVELHGYHLYAAQTKVPLIMRVPGLGTRVVNTPVGHVDILPTLANLAGLAPSTDMMGRSLVDILAGAADPDADGFVFQQLSYEGNHEMRAVASKDCHVIYNVSPDTSWELYRIDRDPGETRDAIDDPGPCAGARSALEVWYDTSEIPAGALEALVLDRPEVANPVVVDFGDEVRLLGVDLPTQPVRVGQAFQVTYTFEARGSLAGGWKIFAHFESPGGRFQGDHEPARPFAWWKSGQFIRYTHSVTVPRNMQPGTYRLWMGLFRQAERRPVSSPTAAVHEDRAEVGSIQVVR